MNAIFKILFAGIMAMLSVSVFAEVSPDGREHYIANLDMNLRAVQSTLIQSVTGFNNACGPTSLLFVSNHYVRNNTGVNSPNMATVSASQSTLRSIYLYLGVGSNSTTSLDQLKSVAQGKFGWTNVARMSASNTVAQNMSNFTSYLTRDIPALGVIRAGYSRNPIPGYDHIVILTAYRREVDEYGRAWNDSQNTRNLDTIAYFEPYYGRTGLIPRKDVTSSGSTSAFSMTGFSFLAVGR